MRRNVQLAFFLQGPRHRNTCNRPWRPIGFWDVKDPTLSRQLAHS
jgi:hypothetical protein